MSLNYFPFDSGAGANMTEANWTKMAKHWLATGVIVGVGNELKAYADSTGMQVKVKTGAAWIEGHYAEADKEQVVAIPSANSSNPRIDRIVLRLDWTANTITLEVLQGVASTSPSAPAMTKNSARWEIGIAQVRVDANAVTIASDKVTDERNFVKNTNTVQNQYTDLVGQNGWSALAGFDKPSYMLDDMGFVRLRGSFYNGTTTTGTVITTLPVGIRPKNTLFVSMVSWYQSSPVTSVLFINPTGTITCYSNVGNTNLPLNMIPPFKAEQ